MSPFPVFVAVGGVFLALALLERRFPLRGPRAAAIRRWLVNLAISVLALATAFVLVKPAATAALKAGDEWRVGVLQWIELPPVLSFVLAVLLLDLAFYGWHLANHRVPLLWRFHVVHHIDPDLDVSTAYRFHFGEVALSALFRLVQILAIGPAPLALAVYELMFHATTLFQHSNLRLPIGVERLLNRVIVTPRMHGIHHSMVQRENRSNFSVVFSFWDRLCRTLVVNVPQGAVVIGLPAYEPAADNRPGLLLLLPFRAQRDAWRRPDGARIPGADRSEAPVAFVLAA